MTLPVLLHWALATVPLTITSDPIAPLSAAGSLRSTVTGRLAGSPGRDCAAAVDASPASGGEGVRRKLFTFVSAISLLLCLATVGLCSV
jgi:hypothetical protein